LPADQSLTDRCHFCHPDEALRDSHANKFSRDNDIRAVTAMQTGRGTTIAKPGRSNPVETSMRSRWFVGSFVAFVALAVVTSSASSVPMRGRVAASGSASINQPVSFSPSSSVAVPEVAAAVDHANAGFAPEPATLGLFGAALIGLAGITRWGLRKRA
jgi:hypothetical protein